jgi:uncharacterized membrane protein
VINRRWRRSRIRSSPWLIPGLYAGGALAAGTVLPRLEQFALPALPSTVNMSAAMAFYSSIASGMLALTGIVFSITIVMVQFSATAYSPRLVLWVARDPVVSHALGIFTATFLYALSALAWVDRAGSGRVPLIGALIVFALLIASIAVFVGLIQRIALLQINRMLKFTGDQARRVIDKTYPPLDSIGAPSAPPILDRKAVSQVLVHRGRPRALQAIDTIALVKLARKANAIVDVTAAVGDTVVESTVLLRVVGANRHIRERRLLDTIHLGDERTFEQDPKYAIRLLVDIAIRALSPAINDPTTAVQALDEIGDLLYRLGKRRLEITVFHDDEGHARVLMASPAWEDFVQLALDEIRAYGADSVQVMRRMRALISDLLEAVPEERRPALRYWEQRVRSTVAKHFADPDEQEQALAEDRQGLGAPRRLQQRAQGSGLTA